MRPAFAVSAISRNLRRQCSELCRQFHSRGYRLGSVPGTWSQRKKQNRGGRGWQRQDMPDSTTALVADRQPIFGSGLVIRDLHLFVAGHSSAH